MLLLKNCKMLGMLLLKKCTLLRKVVHNNLKVMQVKLKVETKVVMM